MRTRLIVAAWLLATCAALATADAPAVAAGVDPPAQRPNIVLILADDLGYTDIAPYGSEINTPTLSRLAARGVRFSNFHTAASCAPSRAMLLTGVDSHRNGVPNIPEALPPEQRRYPHYQGVLGRNVVTVATLLQDAGYHTVMAGKWHLGMTPELLPDQRGFARSVAMADTGADNWEQKPYIPIYAQANWFEDGRALTLPEDFYSSRYLVDRTIEFIDDRRGHGRPFFAYVPFLAVHIPVQAPQAFTDNYAGVYDAGWSVLRQQRRASAVQVGLVPADAGMVEMASTDDWDALDGEQQRYNARRMAVYAGMVEAMDFHIGRLVEHLRTTGELANTIFIFTSDNGAEASGPADPQALGTRVALALQDYRTDGETLGLAGSFNTIGAGFASAAASPLAYYKFHAGEGGMRVPLIVSGGALPANGSVAHAFSFVTDLAPTILELAGVGRPAAHYGGRAIEPMIGRSLVPVLKGQAERVYPEDAPVGYELAGNAALFLGDHKIVRNRGPLGDNRWHLYDIVRDPGETTNLAADQPARLQHMLSLYEAYVRDNGVLPVPAGYRQQRQVALNGLRNRLGMPVVLGLLTLAVVLATLAFWRGRVRMVVRS